jgi:hypothetical protein
LLGLSCGNCIYITALLNFDCCRPEKYVDSLLDLGPSTLLTYMCRYEESENMIPYDLRFSHRWLLSVLCSGYKTVQPVECQPTFRRDILHLASGLSSKPSKKPAWSRQTAILIAFFMFFRNVGWLTTDYTELRPASCSFFAWLTIQHWRWWRHVPSKRRLIFNRLQDAIPRKVELFYQTYCCIES